MEVTESMLVPVRMKSALSEVKEALENAAERSTRPAGVVALPLW